MEVQLHQGIVKSVVDAVVAAGNQPSNVKQIVLTDDEMLAFERSGEFRETIAKYYSTVETMVMDDIVRDRSGRIFSFWLNGILVTRQAGAVPAPFDTLVYGAVTTASPGSITFTKSGLAADGITPIDVMRVGSSYPINDFVMASNDQIEIGLACRVTGISQTFGQADGHYHIALLDSETWEFAVSIGSKNVQVQNITDLYNVQLQLGLDPNEASCVLAAKLNYDSFNNRYYWSDWFNNPILLNGENYSEAMLLQQVHRFDEAGIAGYIPESIVRNPLGSPIGSFPIRVIATPKWKQYNESIQVLATADVTRV
jgi:hypothetical protein